MSHWKLFSVKVIPQIQANVLIYHHPALRKKLISKFRRISPKTSLATLREFYWVATGDQSASLTTQRESLMKDCVKRWIWRTQIWWLTCVNWTKVILISLLCSGRLGSRGSENVSWRTCTIRACVSSSATEILVLRQHHNTACSLGSKWWCRNVSIMLMPLLCCNLLVHEFAISV